MPISARRQKMFIKELLEQGEVALPRIFEILFDGAVNIAEADEVIRGLSFGGFFNMYSDAVCQDGFRLSDALMVNAEHYHARLSSIAGADEHNSKLWQIDVDDSQVSTAGPFKYFAALKQSHYFNVVGNVEDASVMYERVRAFTQYFAFNFSCRRFDVVSSLFSKVVIDRYSEDQLKMAVVDMEMEWGDFEFFDQVKVLEVYAGKDSGRKVFDPMRIPKGVSASARRGISGFHLVSACTPTGIAIFSCAVLLHIIEEDEVFRVCRLEWRDSL